MKSPSRSNIVIDADPRSPCVASAADIFTGDDISAIIAALDVGAGRYPHAGSGDEISAPLAVNGGAGSNIVICGDARYVLSWLPLGPSDLVYADPPYPKSVRSSPRRYYAFEMMEDEEHSLLLYQLMQQKCMVAVSGYHCTLYDDTLSGWNLEEIPTVNRAGKTVTECVWFNWDRTEPADPRFVGENFRERERIKRKAGRWARMLKAMPPHERAAVLAAIDEARSPII